MKCEICGNSYVYSCAHCTRRVMTWGQEGTLYLMKLSKLTDDITADDLVNTVNTYYIGKAKSITDKANVLKIALRRLGYNGKFVGRINRDNTSYLAFRRRENQTARRWGLRNNSCDKCGSKDNLRIHHVVPLSWGGVSSLDNCVTLCESCHRAVHKTVSLLLTRTKLLEYLAPHAAEIEELARQSLSS